MLREEKDESKAQRIRGRGMVSAQHVQDRPMQKYGQPTGRLFNENQNFLTHFDVQRRWGG